MKFNINNLEKSYNETKVINGASFEFEDGKIYGLLGRNGAGKTTLFNCINGDIPFNSGSFSLDGAALSPRDIGYVLSTPNVPDFLTGREFVKFFLDVNPIPGADIDSLFEIVKIAEPDRNKLMKDYSHGMKNKVQMLIALISSPKILLLDEPLTSLDVVVSEEMKALLKRYKDGRITIFSTHILDLAVDLCDEIVLLSHGKLERVDNASLGNDEFKERIITALRDDDGVVERISDATFIDSKGAVSNGNDKIPASSEPSGSDTVIFE